MSSELKNKTVLRPYQRRWVNDTARLTLAVKAAQIGYSLATAAWAVVTCLRQERTLVVFLSRSERQSLELAEKAKQWVDGYRGVLADFYPNQRFGETQVLQHEIRFPNKSRIVALAANPDTARGYTGHVVLDEFAFHRDAEAIWRAAYRQTTLGYKVKVLSTPNGRQGMFYELAKKLGLDSGFRPKRQPVRDHPLVPSSREEGNRAGGARGGVWSGHWCDVHLAVEEGAPIDLQSVRAGCDEDTWLQEYCCQFVAQGSQWISPELFQQCVSSEATVGEGSALPLERGALPFGILYAGWDVARKRDLSVIWVSELVGDVTWTRAVIELSNMPTPDQLRRARALLVGGPPLSPLLPRGGEARSAGWSIQRMNIDASGMGLAIVEELRRDFPDQVEGVQFTQARKEAMAVLARRRMEEMKVRLPEDERVRRAFLSLRKTVNAIGQARFDAEHDERYGHADHWWAFALAEAAAARPARTFHLAEAEFIGRPRAAEMLPGVMETVF